MKLIYGEANFHKIRTGGYWYVDKTRYLELLEHSPDTGEGSIPLSGGGRLGRRTPPT